MATKSQRQKFWSFFSHRRDRSQPSLPKCSPCCDSLGTSNQALQTNSSASAQRRKSVRFQEPEPLPSDPLDIEKSTWILDSSDPKPPESHPVVIVTLETDDKAFRNKDGYGTPTLRSPSHRKPVSKRSGLAEEAPGESNLSIPRQSRSLPSIRPAQHPSRASTGSYFGGKMLFKYLENTREPDNSEASLIWAAEKSSPSSLKGSGVPWPVDHPKSRPDHAAERENDPPNNALKGYKRPSLSRKHHSSNLRETCQRWSLIQSDGCNSGDQAGHTPSNRCRRSIKRSDLKKALPLLPDEHASRQHQEPRSEVPRGECVGATAFPSSPVPEHSRRPPVRTCDTTIHERWAPAVTHNTVVRNVHDARNEHITRHIHKHDFYHRMLPINEIEVLPARHVILRDGAFVELNEDEIPDQTRSDIERELPEILKEAMEGNESIYMPDGLPTPVSPARQGYHEEYRTDTGLQRAETQWIYPSDVEQSRAGTQQRNTIVMDSAGRVVTRDTLSRLDELLRTVGSNI